MIFKPHSTLQPMATINQPISNILTPNYFDEELKNNQRKLLYKRRKAIIDKILKETDLDETK